LADAPFVPGGAVKRDWGVALRCGDRHVQRMFGKIEVIEYQIYAVRPPLWVQLLTLGFIAIVVFTVIYMLIRRGKNKK
jgi:hypothetical protein